MPRLFDDDDFQAEDDMHALQQAEEVRRDPGRLSKARGKAREKIKDLRKVVSREGRSGETMMRDGFRKLD